VAVVAVIMAVVAVALVDIVPSQGQRLSPVFPTQLLLALVVLGLLHLRFKVLLVPIPQ
jgi:hypothetical protein